MPVFRPIQPLAPGFLNLLGLKNLGALPNGLIDEVRPVLDMTSWYLNGNELVASAQDQWQADLGAGPLAGFFQVGSQAITGLNPQTVPDGQLWWVEDLDVWFAVTAPSDPTLTVTFEAAQASAAASLPPTFAAPGFPTRHIVHNCTGFGGFGPSEPPVLTPEFHLPKIGRFFAPAGTQFGLVTAGLAAYDNTPAAQRLSLQLSIRYTPLTI